MSCNGLMTNCNHQSIWYHHMINEGGVVKYDIVARLAKVINLVGWPKLVKFSYFF